MLVKKTKTPKDRIGWVIGWDGQGLVLIQWGLSLPSLGHFTRPADCYEGLHLNKACLIPLPTVTSYEPDTSISSNNDYGAHNANDSSPSSIPHPFLESHLPEVINEALLSTGFSSAQFTAQEGKAKQRAQLH